MNNLTYISDAATRLTIDIEVKDMKQYIPKKLLPMTVIFDEIQKLDYTPKKSRRHLRKR